MRLMIGLILTPMSSVPAMAAADVYSPAYIKGIEQLLCSSMPDGRHGVCHIGLCLL